MQHRSCVCHQLSVSSTPFSDIIPLALSRSRLCHGKRLPNGSAPQRNSHFPPPPPPPQTPPLPLLLCPPSPSLPPLSLHVTHPPPLTDAQPPPPHLTQPLRHLNVQHEETEKTRRRARRRCRAAEGCTRTSRCAHLPVTPMCACSHVYVLVGITVIHLWPRSEINMSSLCVFAASKQACRVTGVLPHCRHPFIASMHHTFS